MRMDSGTRLLLCTAGLAAAAAMTVLGVETARSDNGPELSVPVAGPMNLGGTVTQSAPPSRPDTPAATPPVKAQPAPTAEPG